MASGSSICPRGTSRPASCSFARPGGVVTDFAGRDIGVEHTGLVAGNPAMHAWLLEVPADERDARAVRHAGALARGARRPDRGPGGRRGGGVRWRARAPRWSRWWRGSPRRAGAIRGRHELETRVGEKGRRLRREACRPGARDASAFEAFGRALALPGERRRSASAHPGQGRRLPRGRRRAARRADTLGEARRSDWRSPNAGWQARWGTPRRRSSSRAARRGARGGPCGATCARPATTRRTPSVSLRRRYFWSGWRKASGGCGCCWRTGCAETQAAVRILGPLTVMATVCSKCADRLPSAVTTVHLSPRVLVAGLPTVIIGSIASVIPSSSRGPRLGLP